jgi:hypothetical protein
MKGILFKPDMIKAIVEGRKTVTRRIIKPQPIISQNENGYSFNWQMSPGMVYVCANAPSLSDLMQAMKNKSRYHAGEIIYIKEVWRIINPIGKYLHNPYDFGIEYLSCNHEEQWWTDNGNIMTYPINEKLRSPLFLPEKFARYFTQIVDVRAERLNQLDDAEAIKEGVTVLGRPELNDLSRGKFRYAYVGLWNSINPDYPFSNNPWVWRYEFKLVEKPE